MILRSVHQRSHLFLSNHCCYVVHLVPSGRPVDLHVRIAIETVVIRAAVTMILRSVHQRSHLFLPNTESKSILVLRTKYVAQLVTENYPSTKGFWQIAGKDLPTCHA